MKRSLAVLLPLLALGAFLVMWAGTASAVETPPWANDEEDTTAVSGPIEYSDFNSLGNAITECPQAGLRGDNPKPLRNLVQDAVEKKSNEGSNIRANQDYACMPQDETALDINPIEKQQRRRRRERLPARLGHVRLLRLDRQRQPLVRRDHAVPVAAERRQP